MLLLNFELNLLNANGVIASSAFACCPVRVSSTTWCALALFCT